MHVLLSGPTVIGPLQASYLVNNVSAQVSVLRSSILPNAKLGSLPPQPPASV